MHITVNGDILCKKCWKEAFIQKWRFKCSHTNHGAEYVGFNTLYDLQQAIVNVTKVLDSNDCSDYLMMLEQMEEAIKARWDRSSSKK